MEYYAFNVILVLALFYPSDQTYPVVPMACPDDWFNEPGIGCYKLFWEMFTKEQAMETCFGLDSNLISLNDTYPWIGLGMIEYTDNVWLLDITDYVWLREPNCTAIEMVTFNTINLDCNGSDTALSICTKPEECPLGFVQIEDLCYQLNSSLSYVCYPNGTIVVYNPNTSIFQTSFANGTSNVCTSTYNEDFTKLTITQCDTNEDILLAFTNRTEDYDFIIGGRQVDSYILHCNLVGGVTRSFVQGFSPTLSAVQVTSITPNLNLISALRTGQNFSSPAVNSAVLASLLYWTIDVNVQYYSNPRTCTVYSGNTVSTSVLNTELITDGCTHDADLVGNFGNFVSSSRWTRNVALFHVFKFYNSDYITIQCTVEYCLNATDCVPDCSRRRRRYAPLEGLEEHVITTTLMVLDNALTLGSGAEILVSGAATLLPVFLLHFLS